MAFCSNCGNQINEGAAFCTNCGTKLAVAPVAPPAPAVPPAPYVQQAPAMRKMHCPNCGSYSISINTETTVNGGVSTHHGSFSTTHMSNTHRNYWFCADCGTKFRNIQNLEEEIQKSKSNPVWAGIIAAIGLIITIYLFSLVSSAGDFGFFFYPMLCAPIAATIVGICFVFVYLNRLKKMRAELAYLQEACFR